MNRLYLVRHGENPANVTRQFSYRLVDYPLNKKGVLQARQTARYFSGMRIDEIYASPLRRAVETAQIIAAPLGLTPQMDENFREMNVGDLERFPPTPENWALHCQITDAWQRGEKDVRFPGGESCAELWARFQAGLKSVLAGKDGKNILIAGHGGLFVHTLADLCGNLSDRQENFNINHNCSITEVLVHGCNGRLDAELVRWADHSHLWGEAAELLTGIPENIPLN